MSDDGRISRRRLLAGVAGLATAGGAAFVATGRLTGDEDALPVTVDTLEAPGSSAGTARVPAPDRPTLVDLFATWCPPCAEQMPALGAVHEDYGDRVAFVSVTGERFGGGLTRADVVAWWRDHDGAWTLGHDPQDRLSRAPALPHLALADARGRVVWEHGGVAEEATLRTQLESVLDG